MIEEDCLPHFEPLVQRTSCFTGALLWSVWAIEAELGRRKGGNDGVPMFKLNGLLTDPSFALYFFKETGMHFLAPSFGNVYEQ